MITAGDIQFEQPQPKIWKLGPHAIAMLYGDAIAQAEIAMNTERRVHTEKLTALPEIAAVYSAEAQAYIRRSAEVSVLAPLGLTSASLLGHSSSEVVIELAGQMQGHFRRSGMAHSFGGAIIAGCDGPGRCQIYKVEGNGDVQFMSHVGFVAAGSGQWHAESQFMFSGYTKEWEFPEALSLVYAAKKRAEVAPGVGSETDLVIIMSAPPNLMHSRPDAPVLADLERIYQAAQSKISDALRWQHNEVRKTIENFNKERPPESKLEGSSADDGKTH